MFITEKIKKQIEQEIEGFINSILDAYKNVDNRLFVAGQPINMNKEEIKEVSLSRNKDFYFSFMKAIYEYRDRLKIKVIPFYQDISNVDRSYIFTEGRLKNINSISSKIYQYNHVKKEKGSIVINKCINDIFGVRLIVPFRKLDTTVSVLNTLKAKNNWNCKIIYSVKNDYRAIHMYIYLDNNSFRWEVQFWPKRFDKKNRNSHLLYKQSYTKWESQFNPSDLIEVL